MLIIFKGITIQYLVQQAIQYLYLHIRHFLHLETPEDLLNVHNILMFMNCGMYNRVQLCNTYMYNQLYLYWIAL